jgi:hypothetical protein
VVEQFPGAHDRLDLIGSRIDGFIEEVRQRIALAFVEG